MNKLLISIYEIHFQYVQYCGVSGLHSVNKLFTTIVTCCNLTLSNRLPTSSNNLQMSGKKYIFLALLGLLAFMPFIPYINYVTNVDKMSRCIFCEIVNGQIPQTKIEYESKDFVIFKDIKPASTHHFLAVPKRHIDSAKTLTTEDTGLLLDMEAGLRNFFTKQGIDTNDTLFGFHLPPFISVKHLHMHAIAPRSTMGFASRLMFRAGSPWFKTPDEIRSSLQEKAKVERS